jgi:hypothetical protein
MIVIPVPAVRSSPFHVNALGEVASVEGAGEGLDIPVAPVTIKFYICS